MLEQAMMARFPVDDAVVIGGCCSVDDGECDVHCSLGLRRPANHDQPNSWSTLVPVFLKRLLRPSLDVYIDDYIHTREKTTNDDDFTP